MTYARVVLCSVSYNIASKNLMALYSAHIVLITAPELWAAVKTCRTGWGFVTYILFTSYFHLYLYTPCQALVLKLCCSLPVWPASRVEGFGNSLGCSWGLKAILLLYVHAMSLAYLPGSQWLSGKNCLTRIFKKVLSLNSICHFLGLIWYHLQGHWQQQVSSHS